MECRYCGREAASVCMNTRDMDPIDGFNGDPMCNKALHDLGGGERGFQLPAEDKDTAHEGSGSLGHEGGDFVQAADALHALALEKVYSLMGASDPEGLAELRKWADRVERYEDLRWPIGKPEKV